MLRGKMGISEHHDVALPATELHQFVQRDTSLESPRRECVAQIVPPQRPEFGTFDGSLKGFAVAVAHGSAVPLEDVRTGGAAF